MKCKFCSQETRNEFEICDECEKTLSTAINKNRKKMIKTKIANENRGITSLVCAIIAMTQPFGVIVSFICGIVSIVFGFYARNTEGEKLGKVGRTIGVVSIVSNILAAIIRTIMTVAFVIILILVIFCVNWIYYQLF